MCFDDFFDDLDIEDFAILGGVIGYFEEETEEIKRIEQEQDNDEPCKDDDYESIIP